MKTAKVLGLLLPLVGLAISAPAGATSWNTAGYSFGQTSSIYCSTTQCNTTGGLSGSVITMKAYATPTLQTSANTSPVDTGYWVNSQVAMYSGGGLGAINSVQTGDSNVPQHAVDNRSVNDILVIDFGSNNWDVSSFSLGYTCAINSAGTGCTGATVNVDAWVGGTSAVNFNNVQFSANNTGNLAAFGFSALTLSNDPSGTGVRNDVTNPSTSVGRYLVIAGNLADYTSAFKVSQIVATQNTPPPTGVPLPGTVWLFMLGLMALGFASSRRTAMVRRSVR